MVDQDAELVYNMTRAMVELFDEYKGKAPGINGWAIDKQNYQWVAPYHDGAIRYLKEKGVWNADAQAHNDKLVARQKALADAWKALAAKGVADDAWAGEWGKVRRETLKAGGFKVVF